MSKVLQINLNWESEKSREISRVKFLKIVKLSETFWKVYFWIHLGGKTSN